MKRLISLLLISALILSLFATSVIANSSASQTFQPNNPNRVSLGNGSYAAVINASVMPNENGNLLTMSIRYYNGGTSDLQLSDYWIRVKSASNNKLTYSVKLITDDQEVKKVAVNTSRTLTFHSNVSSDFQLQDVIIDFIKFDFSVAGFERSLGTAKLTNNMFTVPVNNNFDIEIAGLKLNTSVSKSLISKNEKQYKTTVYYSIKNSGKSTVTLPNLQYFILTSEGILYQMQANTGTDVKIAPLTETEIVLRGNVPIEVQELGWKLIVGYPVTSGKEVLPVATYILPKSTQEAGTDLNKEYSFTNLDGVYHVQIDSITRTALEEKDIVTANVTISNKGNESLPVPNLDASFILDEVINQEASVIQPNKIIALQPKQSMSISIYSLIPYTYEFQTLKLVLNEHTSATESEEILSISGKAQFSDIQVIEPDGQYIINTVGNQSEYKLRSVKGYTSLTTKNYTAQIEVTNIEKRQAGLINFAGYFKTADGNVFPVEIAEVKNKMTPGGKALLEVSTIIPSSFDTKGATLVIGEAVQTDDKAGVTAYINPIEFILGDEGSAQVGLTDIDLYPYKLSFSKIRSQIIYGQDRLQVDFNYNLTKDALVQFNEEGKKLVIEIKDEKNDITLSSEYTFSEKVSEGNTLQLGSHSGVFTAVDSDLIFKIQTMNNDFTLNVYEQTADGHKLLVATQKIRWFSTTN